MTTLPPPNQPQAPAEGRLASECSGVALDELQLVLVLTRLVHVVRNVSQDQTSAPTGVEELTTFVMQEIAPADMAPEADPHRCRHDDPECEYLLPRQEYRTACEPSGGTCTGAATTAIGSSRVGAALPSYADDLVLVLTGRGNSVVRAQQTLELVRHKCKY